MPKTLANTFASNKELMGTLATEIGLVSTMNAAEETEEYTSGLDFYGGQKSSKISLNGHKKFQP